MLTESYLYNWRTLEKLYDDFYNTNDYKTLDLLLIETCPYIRYVLSFKYKFLTPSYREDLFQVGLIAVWNVYRDREVVPISHRREDDIIRYRILSYLYKKISQAFHKWVKPQFEDIITGMGGYHIGIDGIKHYTVDTGQLVTEYSESRILSRIHYKQSLVIWKQEVTKVKDSFRLFGELLEIGKFILNFRIFFGHFPVIKLLQQKWSKYYDSEWVLDYVEIRWEINKLRMENKGTWLPETWRSFNHE